MILSVTMNPSIDVSGIVDGIVSGEKAYVTNETHIPGGNGINAARIAHRLGSRVLCSGFLGGNTGQELSEMLSAEKLPHNFIWINGPTRINITVSLRNSADQTRLSFPGPHVSKSNFSHLKKLLDTENASLFMLGGSLPPGVNGRDIAGLVKLFNQKDVPTFIDVPGKLLRDVISAKPTFIKPNLTEYQEMVGKSLKTVQQVLKAAREVSELVPLQCISSVKGGALLVTKDFAWYGKIPAVKIQSTVGAGDSMVGAMAHAYLKAKNFLHSGNGDELLRLGLAAACATLTHHGMKMGNKREILSYKSKIEIKRIN